MPELVRVTDLVAGYAGSRVLHGVSFTLEEGEILAVLGRNGVGKSTLVSAIMGLVRPDSGSVSLDANELVGLPTEAIARHGVGLVPQGRRVFAPLTVREHLTLATRRQRCGPWTTDRVLDLLPRLGERLGHRGDQLSGGEQQMLAIARALLTNPRLLLLDEPSDGLAPSVVGQVRDVIGDLAAEGITIVLVEQHLRLALAVAGPVAVMTKGSITYRTTADELRRDDTRARALLGVD